MISTIKSNKCETVDPESHISDQIESMHYSELYKITKSKFNLSVVDLTSSRFHKPHVNCRAVDANKRRFTPSNTPIGPKKKVNISKSPINTTAY